jgi:nucleotide-binding universal stress UspA family protein
MNILVGIDDSKFSEAAANAVIGQAKSKGADVRLLQVLEPFPVALAEKIRSKDYPGFPSARLKLQNQATEALAKTAERSRSAGFEASVLVEEGDPREVILDHAERWPADLIVVGSHGRKGMNRLLTGSVSEGVARYARCTARIVRIQIIELPVAGKEQDGHHQNDWHH